MNVYYVYILETISKKGRKSYYTGYTNNLHRRWNEHRTGTGAKFCRGKKHIELKYFETFQTRREAMRRELEIKSFSRNQKKELIKSIDIN
ncbi:MAG: GIY-YIG nuclease family protein [Promethearchaeota archaeon]